MEKLPGKTLEDCWVHISWEAKKQLVVTVSGVLATLYDHPLSGLGNIFPSEAMENTSRLSPIIHSQGWPHRGHKHAKQDVPRGPFRSSYDWLNARLSLTTMKYRATLTAKRMILRRHEHSPNDSFVSFPPSENSVIFHDDLSFRNILVDEKGFVTAIVDWEYVSVLPLWKACQFPSFLIGPDRTKRPDHDMEDLTTPNQLYFEHLREWEKT